MAKVIGIDLGTTNSCVSVMEGGNPVVIPNSEGGRTTPSIVAFTKDGERLVGMPAKRQAVVNPDRTIRSIKREMGTDYKKDIDGKKYTPQEISAMILQKLKADAEAYLGEPVKQAVITVPAYFDDAQRKATKDAGQIAGLEVLRIINEPTASSLAYGLDKKTDEKILVYDLGGGTFDVSILEVGDGVFEVKSTNGNTRLGGDDFDERVINFLVEEFKKDQGIDLSSDAKAMQRLKDEAEKAKIELSSAMQTNINIPYITADQNGPKHLDVTLTRAKFESLISDLVDSTLTPVHSALGDAGLKPAEIDEVVFVGGSTRVPLVAEKVKKILNKEPNKGVNPDECVSMGAGIQAGVLTGDVKDILLLDVTPLSLGIETLGGVMTRLIERNTTIPARKAQIFSTAADNQPAVTVHVLQGEREMACDNNTLARFDLTEIPPAPRGIPQIEVAFDIDANGIVHVSAKDLGTGKEQKIKIEVSSGLDDKEIDRMVKEAEKHADEDKQKRELIDAKNQADSVIWQTEKSLNEYGDKLDDSQKKGITDAIETLKKDMESDDAEVIKKSIEEVGKAAQKLGEMMYADVAKQQQAAGEGQPGPAPDAAPKTDDVVDAEFESVDK